MKGNGPPSMSAWVLEGEKQETLKSVYWDFTKRKIGTRGAQQYCPGKGTGHGVWKGFEAFVARYHRSGKISNECYLWTVFRFWFENHLQKVRAFLQEKPSYENTPLKGSPSPLHPSPEEGRKHKKCLGQSLKPYFMDSKCPDATESPWPVAKHRW